MSSNSGTCTIPLELQEEHRDALIFYAEDSADDKNKARELQKAIEGFSFDNGIWGKAVLYDETIPFGQSLISSLDDALKFSTLLFALYSKALEDDGINRETTNASLYHTIENEAKSDTFIPVIWKDGAVLPAYARVKQPLDMRKNNWRDVLKRTISCHLEKRLDREEEQDRLRSRYPGMSDRATNSAAPNDSPSRHKFMPSQHQDGLGNMHRQRSLGNIDVHGNGIHPHDIDVNDHSAPQFPWNYIRSLFSERRLSERGLRYLGVLGFVLISLAMLRARRFGT